MFCGACWYSYSCSYSVLQLPKESMSTSTSKSKIYSIRLGELLLKSNSLNDAEPHRDRYHEGIDDSKGRHKDGHNHLHVVQHEKLIDQVKHPLLVFCICVNESVLDTFDQGLKLALKSDSIHPGLQVDVNEIHGII